MKKSTQYDNISEDEQKLYNHLFREDSGEITALITAMIKNKTAKENNKDNGEIEATEHFTSSAFGMPTASLRRFAELAFLNP